MRIAAGAATAVIGDGRLGQSCARVLHRAGASPVLIGRHAAKLALAHGAAAIALAPVVIDEITIVGSRCGPFAPALEHLASDARAFAPLITACYPLERANEAFTRAAESDALKVLLAP